MVKLIYVFYFLSTCMQGISTYDYIVALREQEEQQEVTEHQSPQMSIISSVTGFSTTSSFAPLQRGSWCTPPRLFLEDQVYRISDHAHFLIVVGKRRKFVFEIFVSYYLKKMDV